MSQALRTDQPCGCWKAVTIRLVPSFDDDGQPKLDEHGGIAMEEQEGIEEGYCPEHSGEILERQLAAQKALAEGDIEGAQRLMLGGEVPDLFRLTEGESEGEKIS